MRNSSQRWLWDKARLQCSTIICTLKGKDQVQYLGSGQFCSILTFFYLKVIKTNVLCYIMCHLKRDATQLSFVKRSRQHQGKAANLNLTSVSPDNVIITTLLCLYHAFPTNNTQQFPNDEMCLSFSISQFMNSYQFCVLPRVQWCRF